MIDELAAAYDWVWGRIDTFPMTVSVVSGSDEDTVIEAFGGRPSEAELMTYDDASALNAKYPGTVEYNVLQVLPSGAWVVGLEPIGFAGEGVTVVPERASANGTFVSVYHHPNARYEITEATAGELTAWFDLLNVIDGIDMEPHIIPDWALSFGFHNGRLFLQALAAVEFRTGVRFQPRWLEIPLRTVRIPLPEPRQGLA